MLPNGETGLQIMKFINASVNSSKTIVFGQTYSYIVSAYLGMHFMHNYFHIFNLQFLIIILNKQSRSSCFT